MELILEHSFHSGSAEDTLALDAKLGKLLQPGDFVGLIGDLGAGKTQLVRGVAAGANVPTAQVASPTFAIVYPYVGRLPIYHADFYRLESYDELYATGFTDLVAGEDDFGPSLWTAAHDIASRLDCCAENLLMPLNC